MQEILSLKNSQLDFYGRLSQSGFCFITARSPDLCICLNYGANFKICFFFLDRQFLAVPLGERTLPVKYHRLSLQFLVTQSEVNKEGELVYLLVNVVKFKAERSKNPWPKMYFLHFCQFKHSKVGKRSMFFRPISEKEWRISNSGKKKRIPESKTGN